MTSAGLTGTDTHTVNVGLPPVSVTITGPTFLEEGQGGTWQANASGGTGAYTCQWQFRGEDATTTVREGEPCRWADLLRLIFRRHTL